MSTYSYRLKGARFLRKYTAPAQTPTYAAETDAQAIVDDFCAVPWTAVAASDATMTSHSEAIADGDTMTGLDRNVVERDSFDAALFCAGHTGGKHRAYANAACYVFELPVAAIGKVLSSLSARVTSDPYNVAGARIHLFTGDTAEIPMNCHELRGENSSGEVVSDGSTATGVAPREERTSGSSTTWHAKTASVLLEPTGGLELKKYLFLFVGLESYSTVRGNWLEGCSYVRNDFAIALTSACADLAADALNDLRPASEEAAQSPFLHSSIPVAVSKVEWWTDGVCESLFFCLRRVRKDGVLTVPFATWRVPTTSGLPFETLLELEGRRVPAGRYILECWQDLDGDGRLDPKEAYATTMPFTLDGAIAPKRLCLEMTEVSPIFIRADLEAAFAVIAENAAFIAEHPHGWPDDDGYSESEGELILENCRALSGRFGANSTDRGYWDLPWASFGIVELIGRDGSTVRGQSVRFRILRSGINGESGNNRPAYDNYTSGALIDGYVDVAAKPVFTEADIFAALDAAGVFDLDWGGARTVFGAGWGNIVETTYRIVLGDGTVASDEANNNFPAALKNVFESGTAQADAANFSVAVKDGRPTFHWTHENTIGKVYPAFRLRIWDGSAAVYDSGMLRAPARDAKGVYSWTLPIAVGGVMTLNGVDVVFAANHDYTWDVSMLDAKFIQAKWEATPSHVGSAPLRVNA